MLKMLSSSWYVLTLIGLLSLGAASPVHAQFQHLLENQGPKYYFHHQHTLLMGEGELQYSTYYQAALRMTNVGGQFGPLWGVQGMWHFTESYMAGAQFYTTLGRALVKEQDVQLEYRYYTFGPTAEWIRYSDELFHFTASVHVPLSISNRLRVEENTVEHQRFTVGLEVSGGGEVNLIPQARLNAQMGYRIPEPNGFGGLFLQLGLKLGFF